mgnify:CR=1 FL=1
MLDLFAGPSVRIRRVTTDDAKQSTDILKLLIERLCRHEDQYPSISRWTGSKVIPDLKNGRRTAYVGFVGELPILSAVVKQGQAAKFCHLSIEDGFQGSKLGHLMFSLMAAEVRHSSEEIHFTLPQSLWDRENGFFESFGFESTIRSSTQYRLFDEELRCSAPFSVVWGRVLAALPKLLTSNPIAGFHVNDGVVLSLHQRHATAVMKGLKTVEIRRRFADRWTGRRASIYASSGTGSLLGTITIRNVIKAKPAEIWERFGTRVGCSYAEFEAYAGARRYLYALELSDPEPYEAPVPLSQLSHLIGQAIHPPQSHSAHSASDQWGRALSVAAILHGHSDKGTRLEPGHRRA